MPSPQTPLPPSGRGVWGEGRIRATSEVLMTEAVIVSAVRTPIGALGGALAAVRPDDLAALVVAEALRRAAVDPAAVEEVYFGCANQAGEDNRNVARMATLLAGLPVEAAAVTFNRLCASGLAAVNATARSEEHT